MLYPCEKAKQALSFELSTTVKIDKLIANDEEFEDLDFEFEISRSDYEDAALKICAKLDGTIYEALKKADMSVDNVDKVILVGGSTRTPFVK